MKATSRARRAAATALILTQIVIPLSTTNAQAAQFYYRHNQQVISDTGEGNPVEPNTPEFVAFNINGNSETLFEATSLPSLGIQLRRHGSSTPYTDGATWTLSSGTLPPGITADIATDGSSLIYAGYPTAVGTFSNITWTVTGADGKQITTQPQTLTVNPRAPLLLTTTPSTTRTLLVDTDDADLTVKASNIAYDDNLNQSNWTVSGQLPTGISYSINGNEVNFNGIPTQIGTFSNIIVAAHDNAGGSATTTLTFNITNQASTILATNVGDSDQILAQYTSQPILGTAIRDATSNTAYTDGASWTLATGSLPPGIQASIAANGSTMTYTGYPTQTGTWTNISWLVEAANGSQVHTNPVSFTVNPRSALTLSAAPTSSRNLLAYFDDAGIQITASNVAFGTALTPQDWTVTGQLPTGVTYSANGNTLTFKGTAEVAGTFNNIAITATDTAGGSAITPVSFNVTTNPAPYVATNTDGDDIVLGQFTTRARNGTAIRDRLSNEAYHAGVTWTLVSGTLPPGITTSTAPDGNWLAYSGYATQLGTWNNIVWEVSDTQNNKIRTKPVSFTVTERSALQLVATPSATRIMNSFIDDAYVSVKSVNSLYGHAIDASSWVVTGTLPPGISYIHKDEGITFIGKATANGTYTANVSAEDTDGTSASITITFEVTASPPPYTASNINGDAITLARHTDASFARTEILNQQNQPYTAATRWEMVSGTLPPGITATVDPISGQFIDYTGYPTQLGTWNDIVWAVSNNTGHVVFTAPMSFTVTERNPLTLTVVPGEKQIVAANVDLLNTTITATNTPYGSAIPQANWTVTDLPPGVEAVKSGNTLTLTGTATTTGIYNVIVTTTDSLGAIASTTATIEVYTNTNSFKQVALGQHHTCGLTLAGGVKCWGYNGDGQLGDGSTTNRTTPVDVIGLQSGVQSISSGHQHTCAILTSGEVKCWGQQADGRLGNGLTATANLSTPVTAVQAGSNMKQISAGAYHTCGVTNAGAAICFGLNTYGGIGDNSTTTRATATTPNTMGSGVSMINVGSYTTCAAKTDGSAWCWGLGNLGQLGHNAKTNSSVPVQALPAGSGVSKIETRGYLTSYGTSCALTNEGIKCWGRNGDGQVGIGNNTDQVRPQTVAGMETAVDMAVAIAHTCGVRADRKLFCWGYNGNGRIGDGTFIGKNTPTATLIGPVTGITGGGDSSCAPTTGGVFCWGGNRNGALGNGNTTAQNTPVPLVY